jgi:hypothetical protein
LRELRSQVFGRAALTGSGARLPILDITVRRADARFASGLVTAAGAVPTGIVAQIDAVGMALTEKAVI